MLRILKSSGKCLLRGGLVLAVSIPIGVAHAKGFKVLYDFAPSTGAFPVGNLSADAAGNLYGAASEGGLSGGFGTVFELAPNGNVKVLHIFSGGDDGNLPFSTMIADKAGNLYGTTAYGGGTSCDSGCGTVFMVTPEGTEKIIYAFAGGSDGEVPLSALLADREGNFYGTTLYGGGTGCTGFGCGTVFKIAPDGTETLLYAFTSLSEGALPGAGLIADKNGNLYGTTIVGGGTSCGGAGCGSVFRITPAGTETVLYSFAGGADGANPEASLIADKAGNFYGTTTAGGGTGCGGSGCGTVFKLAPDGTETVLHAFAGGSDGAVPIANLYADKKGNLYGTTDQGGGGNCSSGCGIVFKLASDGTETVLHAFDGMDGYKPEGGLIADKKGSLYGTTYYGGNPQSCPQSGCGTIFKLKE
jgi:uncharacterized repeat protein (TIGR03803 family)